VALADRLRGRARHLWWWFFPPEVPLPLEVRRLVSAVYPTLDLDAVSLHRGLPHLLKGMARGMALPAALSPRRIRIYIRPRFLEARTVEGLGLLLHEAFHALQIQELGPGLGTLHPFILLYLAAAGGSGFVYWRHPMELDAYQVAGRQRSQFEKACSAAPLARWYGLAAEVGEGPGRPPEWPVVPSSGLAFWRRLAASTPGARRFTGFSGLAAAAPLIALWLLAWALVTAALWLTRLLVEAAGAAAAALLWGLAALAGAFGRYE
jgi:hypothetical protein